MRWWSRSAWSTATGIRGRDQAQAPAPYTEMLRRHVAVQELTVEAALAGDRELAGAAFALDPLAGRGDLHRTEAMVDELLAGHRPLAPAVRRPVVRSHRSGTAEAARRRSAGERLHTNKEDRTCSSASSDWGPWACP